MVVLSGLLCGSLCLLSLYVFATGRPLLADALPPFAVALPAPQPANPNVLSLIYTKGSKEEEVEEAKRCC